MLFDFATSNEIARELGARLRAHRLAQNLQQSELAARAGISERSLSNFERTGQCNLDVFLRVASALRLGDGLSNLFDLKPKSIKAMEQLSIKRVRASRKKGRNKNAG